MSNLHTHIYCDAPIAFLIEEDTLMINATMMAKSVGHNIRPANWLHNKQTQKLINDLCIIRNVKRIELVRVKRGGNRQGTWMAEDVAYKFACWLDPMFAIWCNDTMKKIISDNLLKSKKTIQ